MAKLTYTGAEVQALLDKINALADLAGVKVIYNKEKDALVIPCNLLVEKGLAWNSRLENFSDEEIFTITKAVNVDGKTIKKDPETGALYAVSSGTGGGFDETQLADYLVKNKYVTESALQSYAKTTDLDKYLLRAGGKITGELQITKGDNGTSGGYLYFGDRGYVYITEDTEDHLSIYAGRGIDLSTGGNYSVKINGSAVATEDYVNSALTDYLPLSGGDLSGELNSSSMVRAQSLRVKDSYFAIGSANSNEGFIIYEGGTGWYVSNENLANTFAIIHAGNISRYAIPTSGGVINGDLSVSGAIYGTTLRAASDYLVVRSQVRFLGEGSFSNNAAFLNYGAAAGNVVNILLGKEVSRYNCGYIGYYHSSNTSTSNAITIGGYYADHLMMVFFNGNVAIGGMEANEKLHVYGNILATGRVAWNSSRVLKNIIDERYLTLDEMLQMKSYTYTWKDGRDNLVHVGAVADDIKPILPETVLTDSKDIHSMDYAQTAYVMCASLARELAIAKAEISKLKGVA